ncbi:MAG: hypothetical protein M9934_02015 [Thermomicrobiales bacterium]|nr:hypothetical protein [Thermomicrobiales bacterium]
MQFVIILCLLVTNISASPTPGITAYECPVTAPGTDRPDASGSLFTNDQAVMHQDGIWVSLPEDGVIKLTPQDEILFGLSRGSRADEHTWLRDDGVTGFIVITGKRLDQPSEHTPRNAVSPQRQYVKTGAVKASIAFPSAGCWEVTASVGEHQVTWVMEVRFVDATTTEPQ